MNRAQKPGAHTQEIGDLVRQLTRIDARLQELTHGQADAVVDPATGTPILLQRAQKALRRDKVRLELLLEHLPAVVWTTDDRLQLTSLSGSGSSEAGVEQSRLLGRTIPELVETLDDAPAAVSVHRTALEGQAGSFELRQAGRTYDCFVEPAHDGEGRITGTVGIAVNVTRRVRMEEELRESQTELENRVEERTAELSQAYEELSVSEHEIRQQNEELRAAREDLEAERRRYQDLFEFAPDGYLVTDEAGIVQEINQAAAELLGVREDFLVGKPISLFVANEDQAALYGLMTRAGEGGDGRRVEAELTLHPRGRDAFPASVSTASRRDSDGEGPMRWILRDISESRRLMDENRRQRQFLERLMDVAPVGIAVVSGKEHRFEMANAYYRAIPGAVRPVVGRTFDETFPRALLGDGVALLDKAYRSRKPVRLREREGKRTGEDGQTFWNVDVVPLHRGDDAVESLLIIARDVTREVQARKAAERLAGEMQRQADQLSAVFQSMTDAVIVYDERGTPVQANRAAREAYGVDPAGADLVHLLRNLDIRSAEGGPLEVQDLPSSRALRGETVEEARLLFRNAEGQTRMIVASAAPLRTADALTGSVVVWHDVTEREKLLTEIDSQRRRAEQLAYELQEERDKLQTIMENTHAKLAYLDADFTFVHVNTAYATGSGHPREELIGRNHFELFPDPDNEAIFQRAVDTGEPIFFRGKPFVYPDQPERGITYWDWSLVPVHDRNGDVRGLVFSLLNVTERERLMRQLDAEQARLRAIIDNIPEAIVVVDSHARITLTNRAADEMYERRVPYGEPYTAQGDLCLCHTDGTAYEPRNLPLTRAALDGESHEGLELGLIKPSGEKRDLLVSTAPIGRGVGERSGAVGVFRDITERKRIEQSMQQYAHRLRILHDLDKTILVTHSAEAIAEAALKRLRELIPCRRTSVELFDFNAGEAVVLAVDTEGETRFEAEHRAPLAWNHALDDLKAGRVSQVKDLSRVASSPLLEALQQEGVRSFVSVPLRAGDELMGAMNVAMATTGGPKAEYDAAIREVAQQLAIGIHHARLHRELEAYADELEHRVASRTAQLRASEARFRGIFEQSALGIGLLDRRGRVILGNPALEEMLGRDQEEMIGLRLTAFVHPEEDITLDVAAYRQLTMGERDDHRLETRYVGADGDARWANMVLSLVRDPEGKPQFIIAIVEDITERKKAHEALIQSEKLATTGRLAASLAHEINNPLQTVIGCLGLAEESITGDDDEEDIETYVTMAHDELKRAARIVSRLRDLSRPTEPGQGEPTDVNDIVDGVLKLSRKDLKNNRIQVIRDLADGLPEVVLVEDRIKQVLLNLVLNARDAMPRGGELILRSAYDEATNEVVITVADGGMGMPEDVLVRLFDPFFSTKKEGTGLGLFVSRNIVQEQGGRIEVESTVGEGSTFTVCLPVSPP